jgi:hypothetical protein
VDGVETITNVVKSEIAIGVDDTALVEKISDWKVAGHNDEDAAGKLEYMGLSPGS